MSLITKYISGVNTANVEKVFDKYESIPSRRWISLNSDGQIQSEAVPSSDLKFQLLSNITSTLSNLNSPNLVQITNTRYLFLWEDSVTLTIKYKWINYSNNFQFKTESAIFDTLQTGKKNIVVKKIDATRLFLCYRNTTNSANVSVSVQIADIVGDSLSFNTASVLPNSNYTLNGVNTFFNSTATLIGEIKIDLVSADKFLIFAAGSHKPSDGTTTFTHYGLIQYHCVVTTVSSSIVFGTPNNFVVSSNSAYTYPYSINQSSRQFDVFSSMFKLESGKYVCSESIANIFEACDSGGSNQVNYLQTAWSIKPVIVSGLAVSYGNVTGDTTIAQYFITTDMNGVGNIAEGYASKQILTGSRQITTIDYGTIDNVSWSLYKANIIKFGNNILFNSNSNRFVMLSSIIKLINESKPAVPYSAVSALPATLENYQAHPREYKFKTYLTFNTGTNDLQLYDVAPAYVETISIKSESSLKLGVSNIASFPYPYDLTFNEGKINTSLLRYIPGTTTVEVIYIYGNKMCLMSFDAITEDLIKFKQGILTPIPPNDIRGQLFLDIGRTNEYLYGYVENTTQNGVTSKVRIVEPISGISQKSDTDKILVTYRGVIDGFSGLIPGQAYYMDSAGVLSTTFTAGTNKLVGTAINSSSIFFNGG
jgi:hypothetical protein